MQTRHSISDSDIFLAGTPIIYKCTLQRSIALSSVESELYAACDAAKSTKYI